MVAVHPPGERVGVFDPSDPQGTQALVAWGQTVGLHSLDGANRVRVLGRTRDRPWDISYSPRGDLVASTDLSAETRIFSTAEGAKNPVRVLQGPEYAGSARTPFDPQGRRVSQVGPNGTQVLWDLEEVPDAQPLVIGRPGPSLLSNVVTWDPAGRWLVTGALAGTTMEFWPASSPRRRVLPGFANSYALAFTPDGRWLATCTVNKPVRLWPLSATGRQRAEPRPSGALHLARDAPHGRPRSRGDERRQGAPLSDPRRTGAPSHRSILSLPRPRLRSRRAARRSSSPSPSSPSPTRRCASCACGTCRRGGSGSTPSPT